MTKENVTFSICRGKVRNLATNMTSIVTSVNIPKIGLGLWQITKPDEFRAAFRAALDYGYTHFDSAQAYRNENLLGNEWRSSGLDRESLFITTKIAVTNFGTKRTPKSFAHSLDSLRTNYVDLLLLHFPVSISRKAAWLQLEKIKNTGGARHIGVSNYTVRHLEDMKTYANEMPLVNQVELHVFLQQPELVEYCQKHNIMLEAYSPLAHGKSMDSPLLVSLAAKYHKSTAQIMLKWCLQRGFIVLPKSITAHRIKENIDLFDFELTTHDMHLMKSQDKNLRTCWDPTFIP